MWTRNRVILALITVLAGSAVLAPPAMADLTFQAVGDPIDAGSWMQAFELTTDRAFDYVGLYLIPLPGDVGSGFKADAWDFETLGNPHDFGQVGVGRGPWGTSWTTAAGDSTRDLLWLSHFRGEETTQRFYLTLFAFNNEHNWQGATASWNGSDWTFGIHTPQTHWQEFKDAGGVSVVPAPPAVLLGLLGFGVVGAVRRRMS